MLCVNAKQRVSVECVLQWKSVREAIHNMRQQRERVRVSARGVLQRDRRERDREIEARLREIRARAGKLKQRESAVELLETKLVAWQDKLDTQRVRMMDMRRQWSNSQQLREQQMKLRENAMKVREFEVNEKLKKLFSTNHNNHPTHEESNYNKNADSDCDRKANTMPQRPCLLDTDVMEHDFPLFNVSPTTQSASPHKDSPVLMSSSYLGLLDPCTRNFQMKWGLGADDQQHRKTVSIQSPSLVCSFQRRLNHNHQHNHHYNRQAKGNGAHKTRTCSTFVSNRQPAAPPLIKLHKLRTILADTTNFYDYAFVGKREKGY